MSNLATVADYLAQSRIMLQDTVQPYRYPDSDLVAYMTQALMEMRRVRPDILVGLYNGTLPLFSTAAPTTAVPVDPMYRMSVLYYVVGRAHLIDEEAAQDSRAAALLNKFVAQLLTTAS